MFVGWQAKQTDNKRDQYSETLDRVESSEKFSCGGPETGTSSSSSYLY
jgi:hypothetical protein